MITLFVHMEDVFAFFCQKISALVGTPENVQYYAVTYHYIMRTFHDNLLKSHIVLYLVVEIERDSVFVYTFTSCVCPMLIEKVSNT